MYILNMKNSKFIIDKFAKLIEQGLVSSKDLTTELFNILKSKRDEFLFWILRLSLIHISEPTRLR